MTKALLANPVKDKKQKKRGGVILSMNEESRSNDMAVNN
jgi:hypothetical protein